MSEAHEVDVKWGVKIPMRDGAHLNATLYLPTNMKTPKPAIFSFSPYIADGEHPEAIFLAESGYPYVSVDVRGRGNSDGVFVPFFPDPADGHDMVEWIAAQPWCNGKVAGRGLSYVGFTQWATVRGDPEHLATIVPSAPCYVGLDYPMRFNVFFLFLGLWQIATWGKTAQSKIFEDGRFWRTRYMNFLESGLPFKELPKFLGYESEPFQEWMQHPHRDAYYDRANPTPEQFAKLTIPILTLTGHHDGDQPGAMEFYRQHLKIAGDKANHHLVIGPWDHGGVRTPLAEFMGRKFGADSVLDMKALHRDWYAWTMEGGEKPEFLKKKVGYYVMVADKWRYADTLEEATARTDTLFLDSAINPTGVFQAGSMTKAPAKRAEPDQYVYDPRDLSAAKAQAAEEGALDEDTPVVALDGSLIYHTAPFEADTEVTGVFRLKAWLGIDTPDTDFTAMIYDVGLDGSAEYLTCEVLRARHREDLASEKLIDTTKPLLYDFNRFLFTSQLIRKGHRLRLVLGTNVALSWQKNYNSAKPVADHTMADARTVTVRLFHDEAHPSALIVPIGRPAD